jgi:mono/diheme cytochrome c family protein
MPAWNQSHGGPFTDENVRQLVTFIRAWEPNAPDRKATPKPGDLARGADIFASVCAACHGDGGKGTDRAPALNDPVKLQQFDDSWYRDTIMKGRPAQGMPTWGTVLSPEQITDLLALVDSWRQATPAPPTPTLAATTGTGEEIARPSKAGGPGPALALTGDPTAGAQVFVQNCQKCHGAAGVGGVDNPGSTDGTVPPLKPIDSTLVDKDLKVFAFNVDLFIEHGSTPEGPSPKLTMPAWGDEKTLTPQQIADVIAYLIGLNP